MPDDTRAPPIRVIDPMAMALAPTPGPSPFAPPPSVAVLVNSLELGGAQVAMVQLAIRLHDTGTRVAVLVQSEAAPPRLTVPQGIDVIALGAPTVLASVRPLVRLAQTWRPDVVISALPHNNLAAIVAGLLSRRRFAVIVTEHAPVSRLITHYGGWKFRVLPLLLRLLYPQADAVVGASEGITAELQRLVPRARRLRAIHNPIVDDTVPVRAAQPVALDWARHHGMPVVLGVGRLAPEKDYPTLIRAFALLRKRLPAHLVIAGEGPERPRLEALVDQLGLRHEVALPGAVANPYSLMRRAQVLALTSLFEGFGNVLVEALACGTPVVATDCPVGPREILGPTLAHLLVPVGDAAAVAAALERVIRQPPDPALLLQRVQMFSADASLRAYRELIGSVVAARARRRRRTRLGDRPASRRVPGPRSVLIYMSDLAGGGVERINLLLIQELRRAGIDVTLAVHRLEGELVPLLPADLPVVVFNTGRTFGDVRPLARLLRRTTPDIVLASLDHNNIVAVLAKALARSPARVIICQHNALSQEVALMRSLKYRVVPLCYRILAPLTAGIVAVSRGVADDLARVCGIRRSKVTVVYNPVITEDFPRRLAAGIADPWLDAAGPPVFVTAGRLVAQKDHATLLRAFAIAAARRPMRLLILGNGPLLEELTALAGQLGIAGKVRFGGFVANPLPYFRRAEAFVLSSRYEGLGNVLIEAMACGTPVITTDCPYGPAEIVEGGRYGRLVPPADAQALAAALQPGLRTIWPADLLRERAAHFSVGRAADGYRALMAQVLGATPAVPALVGDGG